jgi:hypothetical protein
MFVEDKMVHHVEEMPFQMVDSLVIKLVLEMEFVVVAVDVDMVQEWMTE